MLLAHWLAMVLTPIMGWVCPVRIDLSTTSQTLLWQTDLRHEGNNTRLLAELVATTTPAPLVIPEVVFQSLDTLCVSHLPGVHPTVGTIGTTNMRRVYRVVSATCMYTAISFGFVHGDLHPGNILFDAATGQVALIDMGTCLRVPELYNNPIIVCTQMFATPVLEIFHLHRIHSTFFVGPYDAVLMHDFLSELFGSGSGGLMSIGDSVALVRKVGAKYGVCVNAASVQFLLQMNMLLTEYSRFSPGYSAWIIFVGDALEMARRSHHPLRALHIQVLEAFHEMIAVSIPHEMDFRTACRVD
jgi:hypothetical protein